MPPPVITLTGPLEFTADLDLFREAIDKVGGLSGLLERALYGPPLFEKPWPDPPKFDLNQVKLTKERIFGHERTTKGGKKKRVHGLFQRCAKHHQLDSKGRARALLCLMEECRFALSVRGRRLRIAIQNDEGVFVGEAYLNPADDGNCNWGKAACLALRRAIDDMLDYDCGNGKWLPFVWKGRDLVPWHKGDAIPVDVSRSVHSYVIHGKNGEVCSYEIST